MLQNNIWYEAIDKYEKDRYLNYFFKIEDEVEYLSIEVFDDKIVHVAFVVDDEESFEENILDNYDFEEINIQQYIRNIIRYAFTGKNVF